MMAGQQRTHFVLYKRIWATAKGSHLHKLHVGCHGAYPLCGLDDTVCVCPLAYTVGMTIGNILAIPDNVFADDACTHLADGLTQAVLNERISMVGASSQQNNHLLLPSAFIQNLLSQLLDACLVVFLCLQSLTESFIGYLRADAERPEIVHHLLLEQTAVSEVDNGRIDRNGGRHTAADDIGIARHDRTVVAVDGRQALLLVEHHVGHQDALHARILQLFYVAVYQLRREADIVAHHHAEGTLVALHLRLRREHNLETTVCEKTVPKRIILIHVQYTRNADAAQGCSVGLTVKEHA